jgi:hypothetical protein
MLRETEAAEANMRVRYRNQNSMMNAEVNPEEMFLIKYKQLHSTYCFAE